MMQMFIIRAMIVPSLFALNAPGFGELRDTCGELHLLSARLPKVQHLLLLPATSFEVSRTSLLNARC
jgi:hypothetical protein